MTNPASSALDEHFLILAPTGRDAALTHDLLGRDGLDSLVCADVRELCARLTREGAAGLLLAEEVLTRPAVRLLAETLDRQESWSDLPILLFTGAVSNPDIGTPLDHVIQKLGNVTLLDRPLRPITMVSATKAALRARRRQYLARAELFEQQRAVRQRDQFLAMLGHELRNPLAAIVMAVQVMQQRHTKEWRIVHRQAAHLTRLVDDLLDVSRVTTGKSQLQCQDLDLVELVSASLQSLESHADDHDIQLTYHPPKEQVLVHADPVRCEQIIVNLVANATKYTPAGGRVDVRLSIDTARGQAVLSVEDSGEGISADMLPRVFDLFAQAEGTLDRARGGMGIGLTLVKSLVELHEGEVRAESAGLGKGSTFSVRLPLLTSPSATQGEAREPAWNEDDPAMELHTATHTKQARCDVLLVEDNADSREMLAMLLERSGHRVHVAEDGAEGISVALAERPTVLLVDIGLPGMDGYAVARKVRQELGNDAFMVALTGYGQPEDRRRSLQAGFDEHLTKPVDVRALERLLSDVERRHLGAEACGSG